jgi:hypothetical protein
MGAPSAIAATFTVTSTLDGTGGCVGTVCPSLRSAISAANAAAGPDQITLQAGVFRIERGSATPEDGNLTGDLDVTGDLTIRGAGAQATTILGALPAGQGERDIHVPGNASLTVSDLTLSGGRAGENASTGTGGGVSSEGSGTLDLERVVVSNNLAEGHASSGYGGGVYKSAGLLVIADSAIVGNSGVRQGAGGGLFITGAATASLTNVVLAGNSTDFLGGAAELEGPTTLAFVTVVANSTELEGGGVLVGGESIHLRSSIVTGNTTGKKGPDCGGLQIISDGGNVGGASCALAGSSDLTTADAELGPLEGSPIPFLEPLTGSPALDRAVGLCPPFDVRGVARPQGVRCDSGAVERPVPVTSGGGGSSSGGGGSSPGGRGTSTVSSAQIAALLAGELTPSGKTAKIAALLKRGGFSLAFKALEPGAAVIDWYQVPPGAKLAKKTKRKPVLVAAGRRTFSAATTTTIKINLTSTGKRLLKHAKRLKLTAKGTFTPTGSAAITKTKVFVLKR